MTDKFTVGSGNLLEATRRRESLIQSQAARLSTTGTSSYRPLPMGPISKYAAESSAMAPKQMSRAAQAAAGHFRPTLSQAANEVIGIAGTATKYAAGQTIKATAKGAFAAGRSLVPAGYKAVNAGAKFFTGATAPQLALAGGIATAGFYMADQMLGRDPSQDIKSAGSALKQISRSMSQKSYSSREFQTSTQGLMMGLNNRRRG